MPTRRLLAYWLMILLPSLAIGGLALHYIRHEKDLLAAQQRASLSDQGRRAAEDILLLVENLQYGLVLSLENLPDAERATALRKVQRSDALVRQVFLFNDREQRVVVPDANEMGRPEVQAFIRRYDALFTGRIPWFPGTAPDLQGGSPADSRWFAGQAAPPPAAEPAAETVSAPAPAPAPIAPPPEQVNTASQAAAAPQPPNAPAPAELGQNVIVVQLDDNTAPGGEANGLAAENTTSSKKVDLANSAKGALFRQIWNEYSPNVNRQQQRLAVPEGQIAQQPSAVPPEEPPVPTDSLAAPAPSIAPASAPASLAAGSGHSYDYLPNQAFPGGGAQAAASAGDSSSSLARGKTLDGSSGRMPTEPAKPGAVLAKSIVAKAEQEDAQVASKFLNDASRPATNTTTVALGGMPLAVNGERKEWDDRTPIDAAPGAAALSDGDARGLTLFAAEEKRKEVSARTDEAYSRHVAASRADSAPLPFSFQEDKPIHSVPDATRMDKALPPVLAAPAAPAVTAAKAAEQIEVKGASRDAGDIVLAGQVTAGWHGQDEIAPVELAQRETTGPRGGFDGDEAAGHEGKARLRDSLDLVGASRKDDFSATASSRGGGGSEAGERFHRMEERARAPRGELAVPVTRPQPLPGLRSGWRPWYWENAFHLLGFVQDTARGETFGVELELLALLSRLPAALDGGTTAAFVLRDQQGGTYFQSRLVEARETPVDVFNLGPSLAFYELAVFPADPRGAAGLARTSFLAMALLVGAFLVSIASGGGLLIAQARASWREAMQKTSFVSNVSHELKTPLTTLRMYTEMLRGGKLSEDKRAQYLDVMLSEGERLSRLVGNVLDFSRLEQGRKKYQMEPLDLGDFTARVVEASRVVFERPELCLTLVPASGPVPVRADPDALEQVLLNLLDNAAKYGGSGGEIRVAVSRRGGRAFVDVLDRGPGVPAEHRARIFDKFHRVDESLTAEQGGCGLGLSIARRLARDHGGDITCEERPGGGAAFRLQLPAAEEARA